ncbi:MAG: hypothetical protein MUE40_06330 [Anaerolineae bacterium]|jgi:hypothetical protein|nr:hypothetical protein [Anaerolineae bacterium]
MGRLRTRFFRPATCLIVLVALVGACAWCGLGGLNLLVEAVRLTLVDTPRVNDTGGQFLARLRDGDGPGAFALLTPALQQQVGDPQRLLDWLPVRVVDWRVLRVNSDADSGRVIAAISFDDGSNRQFAVLVAQNADGWRVTDFTDDVRSLSQIAPGG